MKYYILIFTLIFNSLYSQNIKDYVLENVREINSININDTVFSDLTTIGIAIGNAQLVLLGEQDHGDAPCFEAKARIIKYLHEKKGFDVLAFETDMFALNFCDKKEIKENTYSIWSKCKQTKELFYYLENDSNLIIKGFDIRHKMKYTKNNFLNKIDSLIKTHSPLFFNSSYYKFKTILTEVIQKEYDSKYKGNRAIKKYFYNCIDTISAELKFKQFENKLYWIQELKSLKAHAKNAWSGILNDTRDRQMADNILWLVQKRYPNKKIIIWAHNFHISKTKSWSKFYTNSGKIIADSLKERAYFIGFNSYSGKAGRVLVEEKYTLKQPRKESFENWVNQKKLDFAFIDFTKFDNKNVSFQMKGIYHLSKRNSWLNYYDGVFYIKEMYPCDKIK